MKTVEHCVCGHLREDHVWSGPTGFTPSEWYWCDECLKNDISSNNHRHTFKLDNLQLIEDLAKEKNLV